MATMGEDFRNRLDDVTPCRYGYPDPEPNKPGEDLLYHRHGDLGECLGYEVVWADRRHGATLYSRPEALPKELRSRLMRAEHAALKARREAAGSWGKLKK